MIDLLFTPAAAGCLAALTVLALVMALRQDPAARPVKERLDTYLERAEIEDPTRAIRQLQGSFLRRIVWPMLRSVLQTLGRLAPANSLEQVNRKLVVAGRPGNLTASDFLGLSIVLALVGSVLGFFVGRMVAGNPGVTLLAPLFGALVGLMLPGNWLSGRVARRKDLIQRSLPDALDMLTICVEAGLAFEASLQRVSERWKGPLSDEFARSVAEIRLGVPRSQALRRMAQRCDSPDVFSFVAVLVQADTMGSSIAQVIHGQADQIRVLRRQRAEEKANKAPIKVLIPMVIFIFPALFVIILGPAVPKILDAFSNGMK